MTDDIEHNRQGDVLNRLSNSLFDNFSFSYDEFSDPIRWTHGAGLSRVKKGENGYASLYKIGISPEDLKRESPVKKVLVGVTYGKQSEDGIILDSGKQGLSDPIDLEFRDEFTFDVENNLFYGNSKEISPKEILNIVEEAHMRPTRKIMGFYLRSRLWVWRKFFPFLVKFFDIIFISILWLVSGERIKDGIFSRIWNLRKDKYNNPIQKSEFEESSTVDFFGYKAKRWSVVFYSIFHIILFYIAHYQKVDWPFARVMFENNFLAICYAVFSFAITEADRKSVV